MKPQIYNEKGYTLFLAVLIGVLFSIMLVSLVTFTSSGIAKNNSREDNVQLDGLLDKGLNHIVKEINYKLNQEVIYQEDGLTLTQFNQKFNEIVEKYICGKGNEFTGGDLGTYKACVRDDSFKDSNDMPRVVKYTVYASIDDKEKELQAEVEMGGDAVPDSLKYAVSSYKTGKCKENQNCINGEGNLFLHGGALIEGDMKVDGNLITTNRGYREYVGKYWIDSYFPSAKPAEDNDDSQIVINGETYIFTNKPSYKQHINRNDFSGYPKVDNIGDAFVGGEAPIVVERHPTQNEISISEFKEKFHYDFNDPGVKQINSEDSGGIIRRFKDLNYPNDKLFAYFCVKGIWNECIFNSDKVTTGNFTLIGNNHVGQFATDGNLQIGRHASAFGKTKAVFEEGLYVDGNLTIGDNDVMATTEVEVQGPIFVNGDLTIQSVKGNFNALIYVNGKVTIKHSQIDGKNDEEGSLVIFANEKIEFVDNNRFQDSPVTMKGFFYSKEMIEIAGIESNIRIEGGVSAPKIVLNAIRGRARQLPFDPFKEQVFEARYFDGWEEQAKRPSRLQIAYDPEIIKTYSDLVPEERIHNVIEPKIIERKYN